MDKTFFIVGAGPGDAELLTIKAYKVIKNAEVILFDHLINQEILELTTKDCLKIYVGKHPYDAGASQDEINELIKKYCYQYERVVRLKGGDPYLYGRGFEEWLCAKEIGINVEYIPGISSMQGAGLNDIPLTHRGVSQGVWIITGMKENGELSSDLSLAVHSHSTVIIYMGMRKLAEIARTYVLNNKGDTPAAIIQNASTNKQKKVICLVRDLVKASHENQLNHPAIIVIGAVVNLQYQLSNILESQREII